MRPDLRTVHRRWVQEIKCYTSVQIFTHSFKIFRTLSSVKTKASPTFHHFFRCKFLVIARVFCLSLTFELLLSNIPPIKEQFLHITYQIAWFKCYQDATKGSTLLGGQEIISALRNLKCFLEKGLCTWKIHFCPSPHHHLLWSYSLSTQIWFRKETNPPGKRETPAVQKSLIFTHFSRSATQRHPIQWYLPTHLLGLY